MEHFADLEDPRTRQSMYGLQELLLTAICAVLCGADGWAAVSLWRRANQVWLQQLITAIQERCGFTRLVRAGVRVCWQGNRMKFCSGE